MLVLATPSCGHELPEYQTRLIQPSESLAPRTTPAASEAPPPQASFFDDFNRPDTAFGLGDGWDLRGAEPPTSARALINQAQDGFISSGRFTYAGKDVVSAMRQFRGKVLRVGAFGRWTRAQRGAESTMAIAITPTERLTYDMVHLAVNRSVWELTVRRRGGPLESVATGQFSPILAIDREYQFEVEADERSVTVRVPGREITQKVALSGLLGDHAYWQQYPDRKPAGVVFAFDSVWAAEAGHTLRPVHR
ncbi:hypothetical protein FHR72_002770 [Mycolicibacterium iranicum]|uniref:DUF1349 domain-containing protein n=1 Tax=Mycolicibacterium iranicum TaxID=912594 RepID=A0A839QAQ6_MYCIR|nr:hypothetical protein [Mycolicibacterium iranicum]